MIYPLVISSCSKNESNADSPDNWLQGYHNEDPGALYFSSPADANFLHSVQETLTAAYKSIGYNTMFVKMPATRSLYESNLGAIVDGETVRTRYVPYLETVKVYHYFNVKRNDLVPRLTEVFRKLTGNEVDE